MPRQDDLQEKEESPLSPPTSDFLDWSAFISTAIDITVVLLAVFVSLWKTRQEIQKNLTKVGLHEDSQRRFSSLLKQELDNCLNRMLALSGCDRAILGQFHNHEYFVSGQCRYKFSATNEVCNRGTSYIKGKMQDIPKAKIEAEISELRKSEDKVVSVDVADRRITQDDNTALMKEEYRNHLISIGVQASYDLLLASDKLDIGIIRLQYTHGFPESVDTFDRNRKDILETRDYMQALLIGSLS